MDRSHLPPFAALRAFEAFGRHGKVRRTAMALGVSHAIVSRHLRALEDWLGVMLIDRQGGGLTAAGARYHALIAPAFDQLCAATESTQGGPEARLNIWSVPGFAYLWLTPRLPGFGRREPGSIIDLRPSDSPPDLLRLEAHADLRWLTDDDLQRTAPSRPMVRHVIVRPRVFPVARPGAEWLPSAPLAAAAQLKQLPLLHEAEDSDWRLWFMAQGEAADLPSPAARLWQAHVTLSAACEGQGVALSNAFLAADHLRSGRLVEIGANQPGFRPVGVGAYCLMARDDIGQSLQLSRFRAWLRETVDDAPPDWIAPA